MLLHAVSVSLLGPALAWPLRRLRPCVSETQGALGWCALAAAVWLAVLVLDGVTHVVLLGAAVVFWATAFALDDAHRFLYLLTAVPVMDLTAAILPADQGAVMLAGSLPVGAFAVASAWRWLSREEAYAG